MSQYNIDSHSDGRRVSYAWIAGMLEQDHVTHCRTDLGTLAVRPFSDCYQFTFTPAQAAPDEFLTENYPSAQPNRTPVIRAFAKYDADGMDIAPSAKHHAIVAALALLNGELQSGVEPDEQLTVYSNQGEREATVLAVSGCDALVEYEMPGTVRGTPTTALRIIHFIEGRPIRSRSVSYRAIPRKWIDAMVDAGTEWQGDGQRGHIPFPKLNRS